MVEVGLIVVQITSSLIEKEAVLAQQALRHMFVVRWLLCANDVVSQFCPSITYCTPLPPTMVECVGFVHV